MWDGFFYLCLGLAVATGSCSPEKLEFKEPAPLSKLWDLASSVLAPGAFGNILLPTDILWMVLYLEYIKSKMKKIIKIL